MSIKDDVEELKFCIKVGERPSNDVFERCIDALNKMAVFDQILWERDRAMEQLEANGLRFGHKDDYGWISCSERLPDEDGDYYCHVVHYDDEDFEIHNEYQVTFYKGKWLTHNLVTYKVIAWRPLPKAYGETEK